MSTSQFLHTRLADATHLEFGSAKIDEFPRLVDSLGFAHFQVDGRRPSTPGKAYVESSCTFVLFVVGGSGSMTVDGENIALAPGDLVTVRAGTPWSLEGTVEYVVATNPPFFPEQSEEVDEP